MRDHPPFTAGLGHGERVMQCVLTLAGGDLERLDRYAGEARTDYRDVIVYAENNERARHRAALEALASAPPAHAGLALLEELARRLGAECESIAGLVGLDVAVVDEWAANLDQAASPDSVRGLQRLHAVLTELVADRGERTAVRWLVRNGVWDYIQHGRPFDLDAVERRARASVTQSQRR